MVRSEYLTHSPGSHIQESVALLATEQATNRNGKHTTLRSTRNSSR
jgi:hypothetical protein